MLPARDAGQGGEPELTYDDLLRGGREALRRGAWSDARDRFERAVALSETPDALEGLGAAAWWQSDAPAVLEARERAYGLYLKREDRTGAARMASALALDYVAFRGEMELTRSDGHLIVGGDSPSRKENRWHVHDRHTRPSSELRPSA